MGGVAWVGIDGLEALMAIKFSRNLAIVVGIVTPVLETVRRWSTWQESPAAFFDDFILGGLLLLGAWRVSKDVRTGQKYLTAGWGFMCGMVYPSFFGQLEAMRAGEIDPAPISSEAVLVVKGIGFALAIIGLITSLRSIPNEDV